MKLKYLFATCLSVGVAASACGEVGEEVGAPVPEATAEMALNVDLLGETDVTQFAFKATPVHCSGKKKGEPIRGAEVYKGTQSLEEGLLPGDNSTFEYGPYDAASEHHFSDQFFNVPSGCYDLEAKPLTEAGERSDDCATATLERERVREDRFNEFHLISQCQGTARDSLDVMASMNHAPEVELDIEKFMCSGAGVKACATATDVDDDPLRFYWKGKEQGCYKPKSLGKATINPEDGEATHCVTIPSHLAESKEYEVVVKDLAWNAKKRKMVPIEEILPEQDGRGLDFDPDESQSSLTFGTHALGECTTSPSAFIGVTLGADLEKKHGKLKTDEDRGMSSKQAKQLAENAINYVNPNSAGDSDPRILLVHDKSDDEDKLEAKYIEQLLEKAGFDNVKRIEEPRKGLKPHDTVGRKIVWWVNPGHPMSDDDTYDTLKKFRKQGGGVIISGDDANQRSELDGRRKMSEFSFLGFKGDNGDRACGKLTDNNDGKNYLVKLKRGAPLTDGIRDRTFPYGNDIDRNYLLDDDATVNAYTEGLDMRYKKECLHKKVPVITTVPAGESL